VAVVPSVTGLSGPEAMLRLAMAGLIGGVVGSQVSETVPRGRVVQSSPAEGEEVPDASNVFLFDSMGPASCGVVPEVAGQDLAAARRLVEEAGYLVVELHRSDPVVRDGRAIGTLPEFGTPLPPFSGVGVSVLVSTGREPWDARWPGPGELRDGLHGLPRAQVRELRVAAVQQLDEVTTRLRVRVGALAALVDSLSADPEPRTALIDQLGAELRRLRERLAVGESEMREFRQELDTQSQS
jgi:8-oxo-dGTP pyrophosphatase MutT (NUDIX family)